MSAAIWTIVGVAVAASSLWLSVRIVNRKERWAKRTAFWVMAALVLYVLTIGPVASLVWRGYLSKSTHGFIEFLYWPLFNSPTPIHRGLEWYILLYAPGD